MHAGSPGSFCHFRAMARAAPMLRMLRRALVSMLLLSAALVSMLLIPIGLLLLLFADAAGILPQFERPAEAA